MVFVAETGLSLGADDAPVIIWAVGWWGGNSETDPKRVGFVFLGTCSITRQKDVTRALESLSDGVCSYSFWLETKTTSEKGGGAYAKPEPASLFAGS